MQPSPGWLMLLASMASGCLLDYGGLTGGAVDGSSSCPSRAGPALVFVAAPSPGFCIDATEVTRRDYKAFLDDKAGSTAGQGSTCEWNSSFTPKVWSFNEGELELPVIQVDWCDAVAYCAWAGKRLCGSISGEALPADGVNDAATDAWFAACSLDGARSFPYGNTFQSGACVSNRGSASTVKSAAGCEGGTAGLFDLSGNVREWTNACDGSASGSAAAQDGCWVRGGAFDNSDQTTLACHAKTTDTEYRNTQSDSIGFRCCAPPG